jgi:nitroimidazol reductase NimA-like FMN-containing flavoprotein (pyridoxamine 5'-phosphate oxidase superfamily)
MAMTKDEIDQLLQKDGIGTLALNGRDGYPVAVPIGYVYEEGRVYVMAGNLRKRIVARDPRVTFNVYADTLGDACWVSISGTARLTKEKGFERVRGLHIHSGLSEAETDRMLEPIADSEQELLEITPEYMRSWKMKAPSFVRRTPVSTWLS